MAGLALATLANVALLAFLVALSGFIFSGPEGARGDAAAVAVWSVAVALSVTAIIAGWTLRVRGASPRLVQAAAWAPLAPWTALALWSML